jgi:hypothetical protein
MATAIEGHGHGSLYATNSITVQQPTRSPRDGCPAGHAVGVRGARHADAARRADVARGAVAGEALPSDAGATSQRRAQPASRPRLQEHASALPLLLELIQSRSFDRDLREPGVPVLVQRLLEALLRVLLRNCNSMPCAAEQQEERQQLQLQVGSMCTISRHASSLQSAAQLLCMRFVIWSVLACLGAPGCSQRILCITTPGVALFASTTPT